MALKLTRTDIQNKGLDYVRSLNEFILVVEDWEPNDNPSSYWIEKQGFLYRENMSPNRNGPITYYYYSKQTQEEKDLENLELQIKMLEDKFNISITYTKK